MFPEDEEDEDSENVSPELPVNYTLTLHDSSNGLRPSLDQFIWVQDDQIIAIRTNDTALVGNYTLYLTGVMNDTDGGPESRFA